MEQIELQRAIEAILFAAGERIEVSRLSAVLEVDPDEVTAAADALADDLAFNRRGIRIIRLEDGYQMVSSVRWRIILRKLWRRVNRQNFLHPSWRHLPLLLTISLQPKLWLNRFAVLIVLTPLPLF